MKSRLVRLSDGKASLGIVWHPDEPHPNDAFQGWLGSLVVALEATLRRYELQGAEASGEKTIVLVAKRRGQDVEVDGSPEHLAELGRVALVRLFGVCSLDELRIELEREG